MLWLQLLLKMLRAVPLSPPPFGSGFPAIVKFSGSLGGSLRVLGVVVGHFPDVVQVAV